MTAHTNLTCAACIAAEKIPDEPDYWDYDNSDECPACGGDGYIMAGDGDASDWGEDTYSGPPHATMTCRHCKGSGCLL